MPRINLKINSLKNCQFQVILITGELKMFRSFAEMATAPCSIMGALLSVSSLKCDLHVKDFAFSLIYSLTLSRSTPDHYGFCIYEESCLKLLIEGIPRLYFMQGQEKMVF